MTDPFREARLKAETHIPVIIAGFWNQLAFWERGKYKSDYL
jgi:hypothetical protein